MSLRSLAMLVLLLALSRVSAQEPVGPPEASVGLPAAAGSLLAVRGFTLQTARPYPWRQDHPEIRAGVLLALQVDPDLARPRQVAGPVIYVGDLPAERLNSGWPSGRLLLLVPGSPELSMEPIFFGPPELPERISAEQARAELRRAEVLGLAPFALPEVEAALAAGGAALQLPDARALEHAVADWIDAWAPDEAERASNLRAPAP